MDAESHQGYSLNAHDHFPMLSVFKFPLALYVLDQVDKGRLSPDQRVTINKSSHADEAIREGVIARIARLAYDSFCK
jgi:beta-lactamase class A